LREWLSDIKNSDPLKKQRDKLLDHSIVLDFKATLSSTANSFLLPEYVENIPK